MVFWACKKREKKKKKKVDAVSHKPITGYGQDDDLVKQKAVHENQTSNKTLSLVMNVDVPMKHIKLSISFGRKYVPSLARPKP